MDYPDNFIKFHRLYVLFEGEDPYVYAQRVAEAFRMRQQAENKIKLVYFIDNMPTDGLPMLDKEQIKRL